MIPSKGPAFFQGVSCRYSEQSPLNFVLWYELFSKLTCRPTYGEQLACVYILCKMAQNNSYLAALWLGRNLQMFSGTSQKQEQLRPFGTGLIKPCSQGLFLFLNFLRPNFFLACLGFLLPPLSDPGSPRMWTLESHHKTFHDWCSWKDVQKFKGLVWQVRCTWFPWKYTIIGYIWNCPSVVESVVSLSYGVFRDRNNIK